MDRLIIVMLLSALPAFASNKLDCQSDGLGLIAGRRVTVILPQAAKVNGLKSDFSYLSPALLPVGGMNQKKTEERKVLPLPAIDQGINPADNRDPMLMHMPNKASSKDLLRFSIHFKSFSGKDIESVGKISGHKISIFLPPTLDAQTIKPTFILSDNSTVQMNGQNQLSGQSEVNLTKPVIYQVIDKNRTIKEYVVTSIRIDQVIDSLVKNFIATYTVTGLSFSMTKDERLVYAKGYGIANKATNEVVTPNSLFRIASISKPITAIALMKLVEEKKVSLADKVFGTNSVLGTTYGSVPYLPGYENITVKQILDHTSGLATNDSNDPMFSDYKLTQNQLIDNTIRTRNLLATPGTTYYYSNFGFCVLGRIIEKVAGSTYINYVQNTILAPLGITTIQVTGNTIETRKRGEVIYYHSKYNPYAFNIARMDSHGGLIASSIDLLKLLVRVDGFSAKSDILTAKTINTMTQYNPMTRYSLGWGVNSTNNWSHTGLLTGTSSELVRANNGFSWAILTNYGCVGCKDSYAADLDALGWQIQSIVTKWPDYDLF